MTYEYVDHTGWKLAVAPDPNGPKLFLHVLPQNGEGMGVIVENADASRIALEILKVASPGPAELSDMADAKAALRRVVKHYETNAINKRRDQIARELTAHRNPGYDYDTAGQTLKNAVDRIIELEQAAK